MKNSTAHTLMHIIVIILLSTLCYFLLINDEIDTSHTKYLEKEMQQYQKKLDSTFAINSGLIQNSMSKQESLLQDINNQQLSINDIKLSIQNEKFKLQSASNDENLVYFINYINEHNTSQSESN